MGEHDQAAEVADQVFMAVAATLAEEYDTATAMTTELVEPVSSCVLATLAVGHYVQARMGSSATFEIAVVGDIGDLSANVTAVLTALRHDDLDGVRMLVERLHRTDRLELLHLLVGMATAVLRAELGTGESGKKEDS